MFTKIHLCGIHTLEHCFLGRPMQKQSPRIATPISPGNFISTHKLMSHLMHTLAILLNINSYVITRLP